MLLTEAQAQALCAKVEEKAAAYFAAPATAPACYRPVRAPRRPEPPILSGGLDRQHAEDPEPTSFADWLRGVARVDLIGHMWRVEEFVGQGPGSAEVTIRLR